MFHSRPQPFHAAVRCTGCSDCCVLLRLPHSCGAYRYCDGCVQPGELAFTRSQKGKPHLAWPSSVPLQFSLTHTGSLLGCAVSAGAAVGLDCEESSRHTRRDPLGLARRYFHPREIADCEGVWLPRLAEVYLSA
jgi:phosphopantetheinyl transferase